MAGVFPREMWEDLRNSMDGNQWTNSGKLTNVSAQDLDLLTGPLLFGYLFSFMLFGMLIVQVYSYYQTFPGDNGWIKAFVGLVFLVELVLAIGTCTSAWHSMGSNYGEISSIVQMDPGSLMLQGLTSFVSLLAHGFYVWRISRLSRSKVMPAIIALISITQFCISIFINIYYGKNHRNLHALQDIKVIILLWGTFTGSADVLITLTLLVIMWSAKRQATSKDTRSTIHRIMTFSAKTGIILVIAVILYLVMLYRLSYTYLPTCFYYLIGRLYGITLMASLNGRFNPRAPNLSDTVECDDDDHAQGQCSDPFWEDFRGRKTLSRASSSSHWKKASELRFVAAPNPELREDDEDIELEFSVKTPSSVGCSTRKSTPRKKKRQSVQIQTDDSGLRGLEKSAGEKEEADSSAEA